MSTWINYSVGSPVLSWKYTTQKLIFCGKLEKYHTNKPILFETPYLYDNKQYPKWTWTGNLMDKKKNELTNDFISNLLHIKYCFVYTYATLWHLKEQHVYAFYSKQISLLNYTFIEISTWVVIEVTWGGHRLYSTHS